MTIAEAIEAILAEDFVTARICFAKLAQLLIAPRDLDALRTDRETVQAVGVELCHMMAKDISSMPPDLCLLLQLRAGSTYAKGVARLRWLASPDQGRA